MAKPTNELSRHMMNLHEGVGPGAQRDARHAHAEKSTHVNRGAASALAFNATRSPTVSPAVIRATIHWTRGVVHCAQHPEARHRKFSKSLLGRPSPSTAHPRCFWR